MENEPPLTPSRDRSPGGAAGPRRDPAGQQSLPFDDPAGDVDEPITYQLTAAARREVAPDTLPALAVVPPPVESDPDLDPDDATDTRPARARALHRGGVSTWDVARRLGVDDLVVRAWVGGVDVAVPADQAATDGDAVTSYALARADAARHGRHRLAEDPAFAAGVGLAAGVLHADPHAVTLRASSPQLGARLMAFLTHEAQVDPTAVRVVLRLGRRAAGDLARHRWASALGVDASRIVAVRSRDLTGHDEVQALLHLVDPVAAAELAGWCDALLQPAGDPADVAF